MSFLQKLQESSNNLLKTMATDMHQWSQLSKKKQDLELLLKFNIIEIEFVKKDGQLRKMVCTSNIPLIKVFNEAKRLEKLKLYRQTENDGLECQQNDLVFTYDLIIGNYRYINLTKWKIINIITIKEDNILLLDDLIHELLKTKNAII